MSSQLLHISSTARLVVVLLFVFFGFSPSNSLPSASPSLILHALLDDSFTDDTLPTSDEFKLSTLQNFSYTPSPLATIPLHKLVGIKNIKSLLIVSSFSDSATEKFIIEIHNPEKAKQQYLGETIIYAFVGVTLTNLCAISGFICIPVKRWKYFSHLLNYMMALAVGALFSTAVLVLLPEAMRMIDMPLEFGGQGRTYLYKLVCIPAGALFFFFVEYLLMILPRLLRWKVSPESGNVSERGDANEWYEQLNGARNNSTPEISVEETGDADSGVSICITAITDANKRGQLGRCCLYFTPEKFSQIATVAWMILFGDAFHNFMDGMTIGVGFTESPSVGIALCLSILFEELPHELGDFAVLISSGFSVKSAIVANFLSSCSAYLGMILGLIIGEVSAGALYVFAITAGFFFYISLSNMLPSLRETLEEKEKKNENSFWLFIIQVAGLLTGFGCVLGVALVSDLISF
ncbi:unnamed protein product [Hymenolepis diminuta]|uniref:Zinc transporter ZIP8 n=1 Tax=Hymenolepis diminuta TaxID=6216 RepID=A0A564ZDU9_HYMDI|nr:unnamed protein product [Hymenolepis diminuta]